MGFKMDALINGDLSEGNFLIHLHFTDIFNGNKRNSKQKDDEQTDPPNIFHVSNITKITDFKVYWLKIDWNGIRDLLGFGWFKVYSKNKRISWKKIFHILMDKKEKIRQWFWFMKTHECIKTIHMHCIRIRAESEVFQQSNAIGNFIFWIKFVHRFQQRFTNAIDKWTQKKIKSDIEYWMKRENFKQTIFNVGQIGLNMHRNAL